MAAKKTLLVVMCLDEKLWEFKRVEVSQMCPV